MNTLPRHASPLAALAMQAAAPDPIGLAAGFGRWWLEPASTTLLLSVEAARLLGVASGLRGGAFDSVHSIAPDDLERLRAALASVGDGAKSTTIELRLSTDDHELRWLRLVAMSSTREPGVAVVTGIVTDITAARHAAMREQFAVASTQLLNGTQSLDCAVRKVIELVCKNLGWDCGMYWAAEQSDDGCALLPVTSWSGPAIPAHSALANIARDLRVAEGEGLVGQVWETGEANWIEERGVEHATAFPTLLQSAGICSGFAFPVAYESEDGNRHRPGVLVFFSCLPRQRTAQLPALSAAIGVLIAQTAQRIGQQESIRRLAQVDVLTELSNRRHFHHLLGQECASAGGAPFSVMYIDLDRFKPINDALGHDIGDAVLTEFARRLAALTPADAEAARVGGDEFALFLRAGCTRPVRELAERILQAARTTFLVGERELAISASIGISVYPDHGDNAADLLRHADTAMYRAKRGGRNGVSLFSEGGANHEVASQSAMLQQLTLEAELLHALTDDELFLQYQPVIDAADGEIYGVEALVRWRRADGTVVPPDVFIPIAEQSHLISQIGATVFRKACRDLAILQASGMPHLIMNVNLAARDFAQPQLAADISAVVRASGIAPSDICLELTEGTVMEKAGLVIPVMRELRTMGFQISVDDFGTGYSSLSRLKDLPISGLKIDRAFVRGLPGDRQDRAIVQSILDIGRNMQLKVIAEGVETPGQLAQLRQLGCRYVQGFLLARPAAIGDVIAQYGDIAASSLQERAAAR